MRSIRAKLAVLVLSTVVSAVLLVSFALAWIDVKQRFVTKRLEVQGIAATIAAAVARPLADGDASGVARTLSAVGRIPGITYARVSDADGKPVHQFGFGIVLARQAGAVEPNPEIGPLTALYLETYPVTAPIINGGLAIGQVTLITDMSVLRAELSDSMFSALIAAILAATFGMLLSRRLQRSITSPISKLKYAMQEVAATKDFSRVVEKSSRDEISLLVDAFNGMLSEVRSRDEALARHRDRLEAEVADRTSELADATIAAQAASAAKSEFLATMSHEIRTPLNGMLVVAELMATADLPKQTQRYAEVLLTSGQTLLAIINDILDFSKIEAGKLELEAIPVAPARLLGDVVQLFEPRAIAKGIAVSATIAPEVPDAIVADPVRLTQILSNLFGNAIKFTEHGSVTIAVSMMNAPTLDGPLLQFDVVDTGIGIPPDKLTGIFEAFSQADQTTTRRFGGTGIGLAICRRLAAAMGGEILVTSSLGHGSTFSLRMPVTKANAAAIVTVDHNPTVMAAERRLLSGRRVLAADDNAVNREVLTEALARMGARVHCVEDGEAAVHAVRNEDFDVVLMDCSMPIMDGFEATRVIRKWEHGENRRPIPIIALTAHAMGERADIWREVGMTGYLIKPYTLKSLRDCVADAIGIEVAAAETLPVAVPPSAVSSKLIDVDVLASIQIMQQPGDDLVARVIALYATHAPRALQALLEVKLSGNAQAIAAAAHALRSLSRNIGAIEVGDLCTALERDAHAGDLSMVADRCGTIELVLPATIAALTAELARLSRGREKPVLLQVAPQRR